MSDPPARRLLVSLLCVAAVVVWAAQAADQLDRWSAYALLVVCCVGVIWISLRPEFKRRTPPGHCEHCGYNLRAHGPGDRCPECGTIVLH